MNGFNSNLLDGKTKLHFVGIGGSGMFPLVQILHAVGYEITGSDVGEGDIVEREKAMGIPVYHGHGAENVHGAQLVVYTAATGRLAPLTACMAAMDTMIYIPFLFQGSMPLEIQTLSVFNIALYGAFCFAFLRELRAEAFLPAQN